jgi:formylglycine-generating enzyme
MKLGPSIIAVALAACINISYLKAQDIPAVHMPVYYYRAVLQEKQSSIKADDKLHELLQKLDLIFVDSMSFAPDYANGYDTIVNTSLWIQSSSFYIHATETTNQEYKEFFEAQPYPKNMPDTMVWHNPIAIDDDPFIHYYFQHPAYKDYPVVGVSKTQADSFCKWKTVLLQQELNKQGFKNYKVTVRLPTDAEWQIAYRKTIYQWLKSEENPCYTGAVASTTAEAYVLGCNGYRANFGSITSFRLQNLKRPMPGQTAVVSSVMKSKSLEAPTGVYHLLGNVAEWTQSSGEGSIFPMEQYYYSMGGKILPQTFRPIDSAVLSRRIHTKEQLRTHYCIKGGAFDEDIYYLQPSAMRMAHKDSKFRDVGFRYIVEIKPNLWP